MAKNREEKEWKWRETGTLSYINAESSMDAFTGDAANKIHMPLPDSLAEVQFLVSRKGVCLPSTVSGLLSLNAH